MHIGHVFYILPTENGLENLSFANEDDIAKTQISAIFWEKPPYPLLIRRLASGRGLPVIVPRFRTVGAQFKTSRPEDLHKIHPFFVQ